MNKKLAHLGMIQSVVNRMSVNSFLLKSWSVVLVSALFALSAANTNVDFIILAYFPAIAFWILDGYFIHQERRFRAKYKAVCKTDEEDVDFSMDTSNMATTRNSWPVSTLSTTLLIFHGVVIGSIVIVMFALNGSAVKPYF